jgi:hypothetical protein
MMPKSVSGFQPRSSGGAKKPARQNLPFDRAETAAAAAFPCTHGMVNKD